MGSGGREGGREGGCWVGLGWWFVCVWGRDGGREGSFDQNGSFSERVTGWDVFLEPFSGVRQCSRLGSVAVRACHNKQAGSNVDMSTADNKFRLKEDGQQKNDKLSVQLKKTRD